MTKQLTAAEAKAWRQETGLSQEHFAELLGLSRPTITRIEAGQIPAPEWMTLARTGWRADQGPTDIESVIRRIVREEIAAAHEPIPVLNRKP